MFLVVVDAYSKWPEVFPVKNDTSTMTVELLHTLFSRTGFPEQMVSDYGTQFTSEEFQSFVKGNGIRHTTSVPYNPAMNGLAKRFIESLKQSLKAMGGEKVPLQEKIANFLLAYTNSEHAITGQSPATLFMGRSLRSRLDLLNPDVHRHVQTKQCKQNPKRSVLRTLQVGQNVLAKDYRHHTKSVSQVKYCPRLGPSLILYKLVPIWFGADTLISFWMQQRHRLILLKTSQRVQKLHKALTSMHS